MKTTQLVLIIVMIALSSCARRSTSLLNNKALAMPDALSNQEPVEVESDESDDDQSSGSSDDQQNQNTGNSGSSGGSSDQSGSDQTTTSTTTTVTAAAPAVVKRPVYRAVHSTYGNSYWTASPANIAAVTANYGYVSQGVVFNTAMHITGDCQTPLYSCSNPTVGYFIHHTANCGGSPNTQVEFLGYACQSGNTPTVPLYAMRTDSGYVFYTTNLVEVNFVQRFGYYVVGAYYLPQ